MRTRAKRRENIYGAKWEKLVAGAKRGKTRVGKPRLFSFYFWLVEKLV